MRELWPIKFNQTGNFGTDVASPGDERIRTLVNSSTTFQVSFRSSLYRIYEHLVVSYNGPAATGMAVTLYWSDPPYGNTDNVTIAQQRSDAQQIFPFINGFDSEASNQRWGIRKVLVERDARLVVQFVVAGGLPSGREYQIRGRCFESNDPNQIMCLYRSL
jgi:hypothetical protein